MSLGTLSKDGTNAGMVSFCFTSLSLVKTISHDAIYMKGMPMSQFNYWHHQFSS